MVLKTERLKTTFDAANAIVKWIREAANQIPDGERRQAFEDIFHEAQKINLETSMDMTPAPIAPHSSKFQCLQVSMTGTLARDDGTGGMDGTHILPLDEVHDLETRCNCGAVQIETGLFVHVSMAERARRAAKKDDEGNEGA